MSESWPLDQDQRHKAIDPALSVHVEAPAGSGKTTVLLQRYLTILAAGTRPEDILAMTFTRKAAGELRTRIQEEVFRKRGGENEQAASPLARQLQELVRAAWWRHVNTPGEPFVERLQIMTFHSFCALLLRLLPTVSGLPPGFTVMEEHEASRCQAEAVELLRRHLASLPAQHPDRQAVVRRLVRLNNSWGELAKELQYLLSRRDILVQFLALARASREQGAYLQVLEDQLEDMLLPDVQRLAQEFRQTQLGRQWSELVHYFQEEEAAISATLPANLPGGTLADFAAWVNVAQSILTTEGNCYQSFRMPKFPKGFNSHALADLLRELPASLLPLLQKFQKLSPVLIQADEVEAVRDLMILLDRVVAIYDDLCQARQVVDFPALEEKALQLLAQGGLPELWSYLAGRYQHLLVDECQDTSKQQMDILCHLVAAWPAEGHSLMVVGDPKQSIYGWRQARVELFLRTRQEQRLTSCSTAPPLTILTLETNFRSTAALIDWVNGVFGQTVLRDKATGGVTFHPAVPRPGAEPGVPPQLALFVGEGGREQEAAWLATELQALQGLLQPGEKVGVLLFTRRHLPVYLEAWRRAGLNLRIKDGLALTDSRVVQHAHNVVTALVRPHDNVAWAGLLRGFAGPQPLSVLAAVAACPGDFWYEKLENYVAAGEASRELRGFYQNLTDAAAQLGRQPLQEILSNWLTTVGAWEIAARWEGAQGVANLKAYLDLLTAAAGSTPTGTLQQVTDLLQEAYQPPDPRAQDAPMEVLTVHAAKGLEYDYVYVPFLDWEPLRSGRTQTPFLLEEIPGTGSAILALNRPYYEEKQSTLYLVLKGLGEANQLGEARRLFYVAVTRARKHLFLSGCVPVKKNQDPTISPQSPLGWLWEHYQENARAALLNDGNVTWKEPDMRVLVYQPDTIDQTCGEASAAATTSPRDQSGGAAAPPLPQPLGFRPERRPYELILPSALVADQQEDDAEEGLATADSPFLPLARLRGDLTHRLLELVAHGQPLPSPAAVAAEVARVISDPEGALALAQEILTEVQACQADPFLAPLLSPSLPVAKSEWLVEAWTDLPSGRVEAAGSALKGVYQSQGPFVYRGKIDRLVFDGRQWWLLDYKTSRPGPEQSWQEFEAAEAAKYRPQMEAYRAMAAKFFNLPDPACLQTVLYFTAARRAVFL